MRPHPFHVDVERTHSPRGFPHKDFPHQAGSFGRDASFKALELGREASLARLETLAHLMDSAFVIPGINRRVGFDALIGLVPSSAT